MSIQSQRKPLVISFAMIAFFSLFMLILGTVTVARIEKVPPIPDLPERYLPGSRLPSDAVCACPHDAFGRFNCHVDYLGKKVHISSWTNPGSISITIISADEYTVGDLIAAWGTPTGITQNYGYTYVYWGRRSAYFAASPFQPNSRVALIKYTLEQMRTSPWRGFTNRKR